MEEVEWISSTQVSGSAFAKSRSAPSLPLRRTTASTSSFASVDSLEPLQPWEANQTDVVLCPVQNPCLSSLSQTAAA